MMCCPIHGGDNPNGCTMFENGEKLLGGWTCWTHGCEKKHGSDILGFIRGVLKKDFISTVEFALKFLNNEIDQIEEQEFDISIYEMDKIVETLSKQRKKYIPLITPEIIRKSLFIPSTFFLAKGFSREVLLDFDVGDCYTNGKPMYMRAVTPIYNENYEYVGCAGRDITDTHEVKWLYNRAKDKDGNEIPLKANLYGLYKATEEINRTNTIIIVEGQGDVWRLKEAGLCNAVAMLGAKMLEEQLLILDSLQIYNMVILTDMDQSGRDAVKHIKKMCGRRFNYISPEYSAHDTGDMTVEQINLEIKPLLKGIL